MNGLGAPALFGLLFLVGYLPMQRLRTRGGAAMLAGLGVVLLPLAFWGTRATASASDELLAPVLLALLMLVAYGMATGALTRLFILGRQGLGRRDRIGIATALAVAFLVLMLAVLRALGR